MEKRIAEIHRQTKETDVAVKLDLDGIGKYEIDTVAAGQIQTVEQTITTEGAGADMSVSSENNRNTNRAINRAA